jgi:hypothetical protein
MQEREGHVGFGPVVLKGRLMDYWLVPQPQLALDAAWSCARVKPAWAIERVADLDFRHMNVSIAQPRWSQTVWLSTAVWLSAFVSPSVYFLLLLLASKFQIHVPQTFVLSLLFLIPLAALLICEWVAWSCNKTVGGRIGWMVFTLLAMLFQCAMILVVVRVILVAAIGYAQ